MRVIKLQLEVRVPDTASESEVETAINAALDETPENSLRWDDWLVGAATVTDAWREENDAC